MLGKLLSGGEFSQWASFVTPAFFSVMPAKPLWQRARGLAGGTRDPDRYARAVNARRVLLARSLLTVTLESPGVRAPGWPDASSPPALSAEERASALVELYFHQILHGDVTLLDLRQRSFSERAPLTWRPAAWLADWDVAFSAALRQIYTGFYRADDASFRAGLRALNLDQAEDVFRQHFGGGQRAVRFRVQDFVHTFHQVFVQCKQSKRHLHADFLPLGLYLATLYDHLERLDVAVDVQAAFEKASVLDAADAPINAGL